MLTQAPDPFVEKLREFYESTLVQQKVSFWASVVASSVGLLAVIIALVAYFSNPGNLSESVVLGVAGVLAQFISAAFFYMHNKSTAQVYAGFEKLVKLQDTQLAVSLISRMSEKNHDYMYMNIINVLILRNEPNRELTPELVRALREPGKA
jgi:cytochrome c oxidase subunit IV